MRTVNPGARRPSDEASILAVWALSCPLLESVSEIVVDAAIAGMIDPLRAVPYAILRSATQATSNASPPVRFLHSIMARSMSRRMTRRHLRLRFLDGVVGLEGSLASGLGIAQRRGSTAVHIDREMPETIIGALPGLPVADIVDLGPLASTAYTIGRAVGTHGGVTIHFEVPTIAIRSEGRSHR